LNEAGSEVNLYRPKYSLLHETVWIVAGRLAAADAQKYANAAAAVDDARGQLLQALFEGAVHSYGVSFYIEPPGYEPPSIECDEWLPIEPGWWSHQRCEKRGQGYTLDNIVVRLDDDEIDLFDQDGEWAECGVKKIRLPCADIDCEFGTPEMPVPGTTPEIIDVKIPLKVSEGRKRGRRSANVKTAVFEWLDSQPQGSVPSGTAYTVLAHCYCSEALHLKDDLALVKCVDTIRKQVKKWCQDRHSR
jgi:hypothetical protein